MWINISKKRIIALLIAAAVIFIAAFVIIFLFTLGMAHELTEPGTSGDVQAAAAVMLMR